MAFIKTESLIGKWVTTTKELHACSGKFTKGSRVQIIDNGPRGYDVKDSQGNRVIECGISFYDEASISDTEFPTFTPISFQYGDKEISFDELRSMSNEELYRCLDNLTKATFFDGVQE